MRALGLPRSRRTAIAALLSVLAACTGVSRGGRPAEPVTLDGVTVFRGETGERVDLDAVLATVEDSDVVVLGELHGHPVGLAWNAELFARSLERAPRAVLCLEFLTRETQHLVDAYMDGLIDWHDLSKACAAIPGANPVPHRPMIEAVRASRARDAGAGGARASVVAANAPRIYTRAAREHGYERLATLGAEQRRLFDLPDPMPSGAYREAFYERARGNDESDDADARVDTVYRAQCLWDMTMASSAVRARAYGGRPVFLVVGSFHANDDGGTVQMIRRLDPDARTLVVTFFAASGDVIEPEHLGVADFVVYAGPR